MAIALISVHPRYASKLMDGTKKVELRRTPFKQKISHVVVYATAPVQKIVGVLVIEEVDALPLRDVWIKYGNLTGIEKADFDRYYERASTAVVLVVKDVNPLPEPLPLSALSSNPSPPQSFTYLERSCLAELFPITAKPVPVSNNLLVPLEKGTAKKTVQGREFVYGENDTQRYWSTRQGDRSYDICQNKTGSLWSIYEHHPGGGVVTLNLDGDPNDERAYMRPGPLWRENALQVPLEAWMEILVLHLQQSKEIVHVDA